MLVGIIGKVVEVTREVRRKSLEQQRQREEQVRTEWADVPARPTPPEHPPPPVVAPVPVPPALAPAPPRVTAPPRRRVVRARAPAPVPRPPAPRPLRRETAAPAPVEEPRPLPAAQALLRDPSSARRAIVLHEILGPPRAYRRWGQ